jgi:hypothetical protein
MKAFILIGHYCSFNYLETQFILLRKMNKLINFDIYVGDDCSDSLYYNSEKIGNEKIKPLLENLCLNYNANLISSEKRMGHFDGEKNNLYNIFKIALEKDYDFGMKISQRTLIDYNEWMKFHIDKMHEEIFSFIVHRRVLNTYFFMLNCEKFKNKYDNNFIESFIDHSFFRIPSFEKQFTKFMKLNPEDYVEIEDSKIFINKRQVKQCNKIKKQHKIELQYDCPYYDFHSRNQRIPIIGE